MAEAVGIVLAIAPLIISIFEDYGSTKRCFGAFANYKKYVKTHAKALTIQETIFKKANERLLSQCVEDEDHARQMLANPSHGSWSDEHFALLYLERLADSRAAFEDSIGLISDELAAIRETLSKFDVSGADTGLSAKSLKKRVKYAFKKSNIEALLKQLSERTRDFVSLIDLTTTTQTRAPPHKSTIAIRKQIARFADVQENALDLYEVLSHACTKHTGHQAHLSLQPVFADPTQVKFTIAFSQLSLAQSDEQAPCAKSTWLTVESRLTGRIQATVNEGSLTATKQSLKRAFVGPDIAVVALQPPRKAVKKKVQILDPCADKQLVMAALQAQLPALTNICTHSNFCTHLQRFINEAKPSTAAIGYLELSGSSKHLVYVDSKSLTVTRGQTASNVLTSLHNMLRAAKDDLSQSSSISIPHKIRLARQLAIAVLQFHATPWLQRSWGSREVVVSLPQTTQSADTEDSDPSAYVSAQIHGPHGPLARAPTTPSSMIIRNALLFRLGVMLLEIAFASPLSELTIDRDRHANGPTNTEYFTADRLCRQVSAQMGPKYAEITRKCVHCDFGCDFNLKLSKLQEGFYQDVICELEKLETRMRDW